VDDRAPDPGHLVGRDGRSDAGAAHQDSAIGFAARHEVGHATCHEGEVHGRVVGRADVDHVVAERAHVVHDVWLEGESGVVVPDGYPHALPPSCSVFQLISGRPR
jgi:hypothetical protein